MREREEREHRDKERIHTINILDTDAIKRATVAIISFPASGFACKEIWCQQLEQFQLHQRNYHDSLTYKCQYSTKPHVRSLKISKTSYHLEISPLIPYQYEHNTTQQHFTGTASPCSRSVTLPFSDASFLFLLPCVWKLNSNTIP